MVFVFTGSCELGDFQTNLISIWSTARLELTNQESPGKTRRLARSNQERDNTARPVLANQEMYSTAPPVLSNQERPQLAGHRECNHRHTHDEDHRHLDGAEDDSHNHAPNEDAHIEHVHHENHSHHRHNHSDKNDHLHGDHEHFYGYHRDAGSADGEEEAEWRPYPLQLTQLIICSSKLTKVKASMSQMK
jgi:hypothetical protein